MPFGIEWTVAEGDWATARDVSRQYGPGSAYDEGDLALEELLPGIARFVRDGEPMLPVPVQEPSWQQFSVWSERGRPGAPTPDQTHLARGFSLLISDLAWQLAYHVAEGRFATAPAGSYADYRLSVDALVIRFQKERGRIHILSNEHLDLGWMLVVPEVEFFAGVRRFLTSVGRDLQRRGPDLLQWTTFWPLRPYLRGPFGSDSLSRADA